MLYLIGNWKMAPQKQTQALDLIKKSTTIAKQYKKNLTTVICPPALFVPLAVKTAKAPLLVGSQGTASIETVTQSGLIGAAMLKDAGVSYCIVGHSEMRARGETNKDVHGQIMQLIEKKLIPILCIGEKSRDAQGWYLSEVKEQLETAFVDLSAPQIKKIIVAYEPLWAIGTTATRAATTLECQEMVIFIRKFLSDKYDEKTGKGAVIVYGGSVDELNADSFIKEGGANGFLVGRVSLDPKRFEAVAKAMSK